MASKKEQIRLPNKPIYSLAISVLKARAKHRLGARIISDTSLHDCPQAVVLSNHVSVNDWFLMGWAVYPRRLNVVITRFFYSHPVLAPMLKLMGAIPKDQFAPDIGTIKDILTAAKLGGNIMLFPEGRTTPSGITETVERSTVKLLKKLKLPVIAVHIDGGYLARPKWSASDRRGKIDISVFQLFSADEVKSLSDDEIYERMSQALKTDDYEWQKKARVRYKSKAIAKGLHGLLYICPKCGGHLCTVSSGDTIKCEKCGNSARLNEYYDLSPAGEGDIVPGNIGQWFEWQKTVEREAIAADSSFEYSGHVTLSRPYRGRKWLTPVGDGTATLSREGFRYSGTQDGEHIELFQPISLIPAMAFGCCTTFELYIDHEFYSFTPDNPQSCIKWSVLAEQLHNYTTGDA